MHDWSEEEFDWKSLNEACDYLWKRCRQFARLGVWTKEKWGTMRVSLTCAFWGEWPIHNLFKPGHVRYRWPRWMFLYVDRPLGKFCRIVGLRRVVNAYQLWVLKFFWKRAAKKWPHIAKEIMSDYKWTVEE